MKHYGELLMQMSIFFQTQWSIPMSLVKTFAWQ